MPRVMVLGGAGYIGGAIVKKLIDSKMKNDEIIVVDNLLYEDEYLEDRVTFYYEDISTSYGMKNVLKYFTPDIVLHFAGIVGDEACRIHKKYSEQCNVQSLKWLVDNFKGRIIFPSSCSVYGANDLIVDENSQLNPLSLYAEQKIKAEEVLRERDNTLILRLGTVHGLSPYRFRNDLVTHTLTLKAIKHGQMSVYGGEQYRPLINLDDIAETVIHNMNKNINGTYNISFGNYKIIYIAEKIASITGAKINETEIPFEDMRNYKVNNQKAKDNLEFNPKYDIGKTIAEIVLMYKHGRIKDVSHVKYCNLGRLNFEI